MAELSQFEGSVAIGDAKISLFDVAQVCKTDKAAEVTLDGAQLKKVVDGQALARKRAKGKPAVSNISEAFASVSLSGDSNDLGVAESRAVVFSLLVQGMQLGSMLAEDSLRFLAETLNAQLPIQLPRAGSISFLARLVSGEATFDGVKLPEKLSLAPVSLPLSLLPSGAAWQSVAAVALSALGVAGAQTLLNLSDASAALSVDACQQDDRAFAQQKIDFARPHQGAIETASNLRIMLDNSKAVTQSKEEPASCWAAIPHAHGPAREIVTAAARTTRVELNSPLDGTQPLGVVTSAAHVVQALQLVADNCVARIAQIDASQDTQSALDSLSSVVACVSKSCQSVCIGLSLLTAVRAVESLVLIELAASSSKLDAQEKAKQEAAAKKEEERKRKAAEHASKSKPTQPSKPIEDMTDAERAKWQKAEEKRAAKAKKAAEKAAKKAAKSGGVAGLNLGSGCTKLRTFVRNAGGVSLLPSVFRPVFGQFLGEQLLSAANQFRKPKIAKGTRDFKPDQQIIRHAAFSKITSVFQRHGAVGIDTPVFELRETLMGKYGEDSKLIYDLADQGGEQLSLRYDLTVPFARYVAMNPGNIKRYHIARVYRRDRPAIERGRFREFYQCDYDVAGDYGRMIPDSEVLCVLTDILSSLDIGLYEVKINHRKLLDAMMFVCGVPESKFRPICSAIDKLDKKSWADVKHEMCVDKGLAPEAADKIGEYVKLAGHPNEMLAKLKALPQLMQNKDAAEAVADMDLLFRYLTCFGCVDRFSFDLSLARGLDYYTGVIYEAVLVDNEYGVGSIAAGGRYDTLVGIFSAKNVPCVGVSVGIERVFAIMQKNAEKRAKASGAKLRENNTQVLVVSIGPNLLEERMKLCRDLWDAGVNAEFIYQEKPSSKSQMAVADEKQIPFVVIIGEQEVKDGVVQLKELATRKQEEIKRDEIASHLARLCPPAQTGSTTF